MKKIFTILVIILLTTSNGWAGPPSSPNSSSSVTLDANADAILELAVQQIGLNTQTANTVFAGPTSGDAAIPAFRSLVPADIPNISATYEVQLNDEAGLYAVLSDVDQFYEAGDEDTIAAAISEGALADSIIVSEDIKDGEIVNADISLSAVIDQDKLATLVGANETFGIGWNGDTGIPEKDDIWDWAAVFDSDGDGLFDFLGLEKLTSAPGSPVAGRPYYADGVTWDPSGLSIGKAYYVIYDGASYIALWDEDGTIHLSSLTTVETEYIPIAYMIDGASAPDALATVTSGTEKADARTFAGDADEDLIFVWDIPADLDTTSGIKFKVDCIITSATAPSSETWQFELQGCSLGTGDALDCTLGTAQTSNSGSRSDAQYDMVSTAYSSAMTSTHITDLAVGEKAVFKLYRDVDDSDSYVQPVGAIGVTLKYKRKHDTTF